MRPEYKLIRTLYHKDLNNYQYAPEISDIASAFFVAREETPMFLKNKTYRDEVGEIPINISLEGMNENGCCIITQKPRDIDSIAHELGHWIEYECIGINEFYRNEIEYSAFLNILDDLELTFSINYHINLKKEKQQGGLENLTVTEIFGGETNFINHHLDNHHELYAELFNIWCHKRLQPTIDNYITDFFLEEIEKLKEIVGERLEARYNQNTRSKISLL